MRSLPDLATLLLLPVWCGGTTAEVLSPAAHFSIPPGRPTRCSAKGHLLNAGICQLASADLHSVRAALERYAEIDLNFDHSREANFLAVSAGFFVHASLQPTCCRGLRRAVQTWHSACSILLAAACSNCALLCMPPSCCSGQALADAVETGDAEAFTTAVAEFDSLMRLDAWKTALLVRVKRKLASREEVEEEDLT